MTISKNKVVSLVYQLRVDSKEGEVIESLTSDNPLSFLFGAGNLLPKFEQNIDGLKVGESFDFDLEAKDAYGEVNNEAIVDVPLSVFMADGVLDEKLVQVGNTIPMRDNAGNRLNGVVKAVTDSNVNMDFNHPLAGNHLFFSGEVTDVREATDEELSHGHVHAEGCGGGCGCGDEAADSGCGSGNCGC
ncbi:MAG TPA: peptidylprolyl isomerase [Bacteroidales bacterium]|jgi:FKBP-type peptidyl-prolyl cis-trans isomerase SlyD|nr:peptidylprolyl isomerase [Bacteroidales bacterium]